MPDILLDEEKMKFHYFLKVELIFALIFAPLTTGAVIT